VDKFGSRVPTPEIFDDSDRQTVAYLALPALAMVQPIIEGLMTDLTASADALEDPEWAATYRLDIRKGYVSCIQANNGLYHWHLKKPSPPNEMCPSGNHM
jgi:hypothetical protein